MPISITPQLILAAAKKRGWSTKILSEEYSLYRIDVSPEEHYYVQNITTSKSTALNEYISQRKDLFGDLVSALGIRTPETIVLNDDRQQAKEFLKKHSRIVVKPTDQAHGKGITLDVTTDAELEEAVIYATAFGSKYLLQRQIEGDDYRLLYIDGVLAAAAIRKPAFVIGDGNHTIEQLIRIENNSDRRGAGYQDLFTHIDTIGSERYLGKLLQTIPPEGEETRVIGVANIGRGGVAIDVTETIDQELVTIGKKVVDHFGIGLCGVDFLVTANGEAYLIEINTAPSLGLHEAPFIGKSRGTPDKFLDWLVKK